MQHYRPDLLLSPSVQDFIVLNENIDLREFVLRRGEVGGVPSSLIADQISGRKKSKEKIPEYYNSKGIIYPRPQNLEQASSSFTARFKADVLLKSVGQKNTVVDLTGGFGIDTFFLSNKFSRVVYVEPDVDLLAIAKHNHSVLGASNIEHFELTAEEFVESKDGNVDAILIDPSRRINTQKVSGLKDSVPDVVALQNFLFARTEVVLVKASPLLDITAALKELRFVSEVYVVSVKNDCKELLFLGKRGSTGSPVVHAINMSTDGLQDFSFQLDEEKSAIPMTSDPLLYLYEPNVSILKAGAFKLVACRFNLSKLAVSSHIYTSAEIHQDFPGRIFKVDSVLNDAGKSFRESFPDRKANIIARNYPLSVAGLRSRYKLVEGGERYLIATTSEKKRFLLAATRLK